MAVRTYNGGAFQKLGTEESHTVESYERRIHGTPYSEPQRQFSHNQYTERRTYGRDENGEIVVKIEKDPKEPVRPVSPVRPVTPTGGAIRHRQDEHLLKPIQPFDALPLTIPRVEVHKKSNSSGSPHSLNSYHDDFSPRSGVSFANASPRSRSSGGLSPRSNASGGSNKSGVGIKKVVRKSRWVSIHDGRPVSPYVETVTYEPTVILPNNSNALSLVPVNGNGYTNGNSYRGGSSPRSSPQRRNFSEPIGRTAGECAIIVQNPLYRGD